MKLIVKNQTVKISNIHCVDAGTAGKAADPLYTNLLARGVKSTPII